LLQTHHSLLRKYNRLAVRLKDSPNLDDRLKVYQ
jgi:hypothetical protein